MIPFIDLQAQRKKIGPSLDAAIAKVLEHGRFVFGPEIDQLEEQLADFVEAKHGVACGNGTDALQIVLMAWGVGPGDAVFCPSFTFAATAEVVALVGAEPVMIDVLPDTFNMDPADLDAAIGAVKAEGRLHPTAVIAVDLFGLCADYPAIAPIARKHDLKLLADAAQGFGATLDDKHPLHWADAATTSFFPAKPLGCYGDGGAMFTNDEGLAQVLRSIRMHGNGEDRYDNVRIGLNSRLDTIQAAILLEKLSVFSDEIYLRNAVASRYSARLHNVVQTPFIPEGARSVWAQYTIKTDQREALSAHLRDEGVPSAVYYAKPLHQQTAYKDYPLAPSGLQVTDALADQVLSLPMHPYLSEDDQAHIIDAVCAFFETA